MKPLILFIVCLGLSLTKAHSIGIGMYGFDRKYTEMVNEAIRSKIEKTVNYMTSSEMNEDQIKKVLRDLIEDLQNGQSNFLTKSVGLPHQIQMMNQVLSDFKKESEVANLNKIEAIISILRDLFKVDYDYLSEGLEGDLATKESRFNFSNICRSIVSNFARSI